MKRSFENNFLSKTNENCLFCLNITVRRLLTRYYETRYLVII